MKTIKYLIKSLVMKKALFLFFGLFLLVDFSFGQNGIGNDQMFQYGSGSTFRFNNLPVKKGETTGTYYLHEDWTKANIKLTTEEVIENYEIKINVKEKNIEIKSEDEILLLDFDQILTVQCENNGILENYVNSKNFLETEELGFAQLMYNGSVKLFQQPELVLLPANYNTAMAAGTNNDKYVIENKLYLYINNDLIQIKNNKKSVLKALNDKEEMLSSYIKENKIKFKEISDLILVIDYYNQI